MNATDASGQSIVQRIRVDLVVAPVDAALHRVLAACHRRRLTIDRLDYTRSSPTNRIVMEVLVTPGRADFVGAVLGGDPLVVRCTTSPLASFGPPARTSVPDTTVLADKRSTQDELA